MHHSAKTFKPATGYNVVADRSINDMHVWVQIIDPKICFVMSVSPVYKKNTFLSVS